VSVSAAIDGVIREDAIAAVLTGLAILLISPQLTQQIAGAIPAACQLYLCNNRKYK